MSRPRKDSDHKPIRVRALTDPQDIAASEAFDRALRATGIEQQALAESLGVSPGTISQWANKRLAIPAIRAKRVAELVNADPAEISVEWRTLRAEMGLSQPQRLDPQMMSEALVAVLRAQEKQNRAFMPGLISHALCALYEVRSSMFPARMNQKQLRTFDELVESQMAQVWGEADERDAFGRADTDRGRKHPAAADAGRKTNAG